MNERIESQGKTVEEAVSEALLKLGARENEVDVKILEEGKSGFLGVFGNRPARVLVSLKDAPARERRGGRSLRGRNQVRQKDARKSEETPQAQPRRGGGRPNQKSGSRSRAGAAPKPRSRPEPSAQAVPSAQAAPSAQPEPRAEPAADAQPGNIREEAAGIPAISRVQPLSGIKAEEIASGLESITNELMNRSGFHCRCEVKQGEYHTVKLITDDSSAGILIGRRGATVDAIEHLVERMASHAVGDRVQMNLDVNNYRLRRQDNLIERVQEIMQRVEEGGREVHLEPLSARERRLIHLEVAKNPQLRTFTIMNSSGKHVVVARADTQREGAQTAPSAADAPEDDQPGRFSDQDYS